MVETPRKHLLKSFINFYEFRTPQTYSASQYFTTLLYLIFYQYFTALYFTAVTEGTAPTQMNVVAGFCAGCSKIFHKQAGWMGAPDESGRSCTVLQDCGSLQQRVRASFKQRRGEHPGCRWTIPPLRQHPQPPSSPRTLGTPLVSATAPRGVP